VENDFFRQQAEINGWGASQVAKNIRPCVNGFKTRGKSQNNHYFAQFMQGQRKQQQSKAASRRK